MQENAPRRALGRNLIVIALVAAIALGLGLYAYLSRGNPPVIPARDGGDQAADVQSFLYVRVGGRITNIEPLDEEREITISQPTGEVNVVHIGRNSFYMASSTCDNQLCVGEGEVTADNYQRRILGPYVLCLPNRVELEIVVPAATASPDALDN